MLICPLCQTGFRQQERTLRCERNHAFDLAREGYVNLLPSGGKRPKFLGDSKEMLRARRAFFDAGFYAPLASAIEQAAEETLASKTAVSPPTVIDLGCGEGYYVGQLAQNHPDTCYFGVDIAKEAMRLAARRHKQVQFVVADSKRPLPFRPSAANLLLNIFAPRNPQEFSRLLSENGRLLIVIPQKSHLLELRQAISLLNIEQDKEAKINVQLAPWFQPLQQKTVSFELSLSAESAQQLIAMSPSARHLSQADWAKISSIDSFQTKAAFRLLQFQKRIL